MKYLASFHTTLKISRYLFRVLAIMLWALGAMISVFYISSVLYKKESELRQEYNLSFDQAQSYIRRASDIIREIKYVAENRLKMPADTRESFLSGQSDAPSFYPLLNGARCDAAYSGGQHPLRALSNFFYDWRENFSAAYNLNRVFFVSADRQCMVDFGIRNQSLDRDNLIKNVQERFLAAQDKDGINDGREETVYWISASTLSDIGYFYALTPVYVGNKLEALLGIEQTIRLDDFVVAGNWLPGAMLLDQNNNSLLQFSGEGRQVPVALDYPDRAWFGYANGYKEIVLKKNLPPTSFSIVYSLPLRMLLMNINTLLVNIALLNILSAILLFTLAWLFERRMFLPAEKNAFQLEEHEQFNRKIVASAPVGISILRISDGSNILSNELAHNYFNLLTREDRQRITRIICEQQSRFVDVMTSKKQHLQISFVHSRYRNENVAICVLLDVSARVRMEESLQEIASAAEQASQSKSMFLATVSHELRTPLYGIIGNLDLLQTQDLPKDVNRLVTAMNNSSALLLKIINDLLDFSKIESEQLKIEPREFSPHDVVRHTAGNYLPLVVKKRLTLYCFIDPGVPDSLSGDPVRLQQILSNLLSNAIKFTDTGCIVFQATCRNDYLEFLVHDTGMGIPPREAMRLFDPFFQVGSGVQRHFQGTGLGLAICEKLVNLMDGDITIESEPGLGSEFGVRIPLYAARRKPAAPGERLQGKTVWLLIRNARLERYLTDLLTPYGLLMKYDYQGDPLDADDIILTDDEDWMPPGAKAHILLSSTHIGSAQQLSPGCWHCSTSLPQDLPALLERICRPAEAAEPLLLPRQRPAVLTSAKNSDIRILVVDDHPINRRLLADQLGSLGYEVVTANDGVDALSVLGRHAIDIVLTDVNMPNMDGYLLTQRLRQDGQGFPVIGVTANALAEERERCLQAGMDDCLSKPVTLETLQTTLRTYSEQVRDARRRSNSQQQS
ncbi:two-component system sensor histidine kinase RcsC [Affinibrenneria salicis]|uniref:Sensor histidine kinase RcsC n=1 Tax=Affinibrenneria salicis TaxID=2590031 RepID=A0A5J5G0E1_9GAMM|nr:two-component system sensor histidine kinase RcsC [Affinibrenneria salicis]KAA9000012.1 two-component system sensor histidine kinase RcsC [Affinibrenneria salicis]